MVQYKYKFSVVTAVYKVEDYVAETIESLIAQDIGFENIQLILVDDGTPDKSGEICDRYAEKYPNITVIHTENGGVSSARNVGLEKVEGKYVNFLDADDKLSADTLKNVWNFFEKHYDETDVVTIPLIFFDGYTGIHPLNYKFEGDSRVVDLNVNWDYIQLSTSSTFIKKDILMKFRFDTRLAYAEDAQLLQKVLLNRQTLGVVTDSEYLYRRRTTGAPSAIQSSFKSLGWYLPYLKHFQQHTINYATENYGKTPKFIQFTLMYDLQWRIKRPTLPYDILSKEETEEYISIIKKIFSYIDDDVIMAQRQIYKEHKFLIFMLKYGCVPEIKSTENDIVYRFSKEAEFRPSEFKSKLSFLEIKNNQLILEGIVARINIPFDSFEITAYVNGISQKCEVSELGKPTVALDNEISKNYRYRVHIPLEEGKKYEIKIGAIINGIDVVFTRLESTQYLPVTDAYKASYCKIGNLIVKKKKNLIKIQKSNPIKHLLYEIMFLLEILFKKSRNGKKAAVMRIMMHICKLFVKKPIWLISDRASVAGDNGEAFFRYMVKNHPEID
ncbi:MAG: glycosyltransferase, partial [Oscillospiraceae bacterium]|nr:glycosyltransferase [Oscillospiraceae bacterium]